MGAVTVMQLSYASGNSFTIGLEIEDSLKVLRMLYRSLILRTEEMAIVPFVADLVHYTEQKAVPELAQGQASISHDAEE
jgi:hypothetical protein